MDYLKNRYKKEDPRINIRDLIGYILAHKVLLIVAVFFFACALGFLSGRKADNYNDEQIHEILSKLTQEEADEKFKEITLSENEIAEYEGLKASLSEAAAKSAEYSAYLDDSMYMTVSPTEVHTYTKLITLRSSDSNAGAVSGEIGNAYVAYLNQNTGFLSENAAKYGTEENYLKELLSITFDGSVYTATDAAGKAYTTFVVKLYAFSSSDEMSKDIAEAAYGELEAYKKEIDNRYAIHRIESVDNASAVINDTGMEAEQINRRNTNASLMNQRNDMNNRINSFVMTKVKNVTEDSLRNPDTGFNVKKAVKGAVLGAAAGVMAVIIFFLIAYLAGNRIVSAVALSDRYTVCVLAGNEESVKNGSASARLFNSCPEAKKVMILGEADDERKEEVKNALASKAVECVVFKSLKNNADAVEKLADMDAVIFAETKGKSHYTVLEDDLEILSSGKEVFTGVVLF